MSGGSMDINAVALAKVYAFPKRRPVWKSFEWWAKNRRMLGEKTIEDYLYWIESAESWMKAHGLALETATHQDLLEYFDNLKPTYSTRKNVRCALIAYYAYLAAVDVRTDDPATPLPKMKRPKVVHRPLPLSRTPAFIEIAYKDRRPVLPCLCMLYLNTGVRLSELCKRRKDDRIDSCLVLTVKGGGERLVYMNEEARSALNEFEAVRNRLYPDSPWMFPSPRFPERHISPEWVYDKIRSFGEKAGIANCHPHRLRHTFATTLYADTSDILMVKDALGHADVKNTMIYTEGNQSLTKGALERLPFKRPTSGLAARATERRSP